MKNLGTIERVLRVALGGTVAIWVLVLLLGNGGLVERLLYVAVIALGVDFVVTGLRGYCPLYKRLGWSTAPPEAQGSNERKPPMSNLGTIERVLRVALGGSLAVLALVLLLGHDAVVWRMLYIALIALGIDFVVTGIRGYCPLYNRLGWSTASPEAHA